MVEAVKEQGGGPVLTGAAREAVVERLAKVIQSPHNRHHVAGDDIGTWRARAVLADVERLRAEGVI